MLTFEEWMDRARNYAKQKYGISDEVSLKYMQRSGWEVYYNKNIDPEKAIDDDMRYYPELKKN